MTGVQTCALPILQFKDSTHQVVGIFYKDNQGDFVILASATDQSSYNRLTRLLNSMLTIFVIFSILLLVSGRLIAEKILQPLHHFMAEFKKVGSSNLEFRVKETDASDEINQLVKSFNHLMEELEQAFILQKTFVANASHELRTPITSVMMSVELALSKEREIANYQQTLESVLEDVVKVNNIITGLLTLAKADIEHATAHLSDLNLFELLEEIKTEWFKKGLNIRLTAQKQIGELMVSANSVLLQIAINNIIANGFKFSNNQALTCSIHSNETKIEIQITDQGIGIGNEDLAAIFKPFYSRSKKVGKKGEGMGLYMASKIVHLFKGEIKVSSKTGFGSTFIIHLPRA